MEKLFQAIVQLEDLLVYGFLFSMFIVGAKHKFEWVTSVRSLATIILTLTVCDLAFDGKIDPKDFLLLVSLAYNFYFLAKQRAKPEDQIKGKEIEQ
jgi:hypothetical protein